eukprot:11190729-Lingulodinium_polyedra.AAC.1
MQGPEAPRRGRRHRAARYNRNARASSCRTRRRPRLKPRPTVAPRLAGGCSSPTSRPAASSVRLKER